MACSVLCRASRNFYGEPTCPSKTFRVDTFGHGGTAASYTSVSKKRLEKMRCAGGGPRYYKRGRSVFYSLQDLDEWMRAGAQMSTSERPAA